MSLRRASVTLLALVFVGCSAEIGPSPRGEHDAGQNASRRDAASSASEARAEPDGGSWPTEGGRDAELRALDATAGAAPDSQQDVLPAAPEADAAAGPAPDAAVQPKPTAAAAKVAAQLGKPARLLIGLGTVDGSEVAGQGIKIDLFDRYLVGLGKSGGWQTWNPNGTYVDSVCAEADGIGAVPMFTLYQMASLGDGNLGGINDTGFMSQFWDGVRVMFQRLAVYGKPAIVNVEPDFWGYVLSQGPAPERWQLAAQVKMAPECASLPNTAAGLGKCIVRMARQIAPKVLLGFPPSIWGKPIGEVVAFMNQVGTAESDLVIMQTLDRDAGCFESKGPSCERSGNFYWDETNTKSPNFKEHLQEARQLHEGLKKPLLWWQTPLGVPNAAPGGTQYRYRDNRVRYIFAHPQEFVDVGALGIVFSTGEHTQTNIKTDGGQFQRAAKAYMANPVPLP